MNVRAAWERRITKGATPRSRFRPRSKYGARPARVDGVQFHSQKEARRYQELRLLEQAGAIQGLILQPVYRLFVRPFAGDPSELIGVGHYVADFAYVEAGVTITEDVKGVKTPVYRLKKRLVEALYGIQIRET